MGSIADVQGELSLEWETAGQENHAMKAQAVPLEEKG